MLRTATRQANSGHSVSVLGAEPDPQALPETVKTYGLEVPDYHNLSGLAKVRAAKNVLWSKPAALAVDAAVKEFQPDVVHLHNYAHQLSSSILAAISGYGVPTVYTAHDYKLICPAYVANVDNKDCFACSVKLSSRLVREKCHHESFAWSSVVGIEAMLVRRRQLVPDSIIGPSQFMTDSLKSSWLGGLADIQLVRNPVAASGQEWEGDGDYLLYVGRLSREKGVEELVRAAASMDIPLKVAGDGPIRNDLEALVGAIGAPVDFVGHTGQEKLANLRKHCRAQVVSSTWPENAPLSALEAAADGVPLIVTSRGGLPEFATFGARVVVLSDLGAGELSRAVRALPSAAGDLEQFRRATSWDNHLSELQRIYCEADRG